VIVLSAIQLPSFSNAEAEEPAIVDVSILPGAISLTDNAYTPNPVLVKVGDTIRWTNHDSTLHTAISGNPVDGPTWVFGGRNDNPEFPNYMAPGQKQEFTFTEEAVHDYYCMLHPAMTGKVIVGEERSLPGLTIVTDKPFYGPGETINITGKVTNRTDFNLIAIQIINPHNAAYRFELVSPSADGSFAVPISIGGPLGISGTYVVKAEYGDFYASTSFYYQAPQYYLKVNAVSQNGSPLNMWTSVELFRSGNTGATISSFSPASFGLDMGVAYPVTVSDYLDSKFSHWENESTERTRLITLSENTTITAYYQSGKSIRGFTSLTYEGTGTEPDLTVSASTIDGKQLHMWTRIQNLETTEDGTTYTVTPRDFMGRYFDHWEDGSTQRTRTLTIDEDTSVTAYYREA
jgi:plastocyanin